MAATAGGVDFYVLPPALFGEVLYGCESNQQ